MFVRIAIDQTVSLHEADDLGRLHVEVAGLDGVVLKAAVRRHGLGRIDDDGDVELRVASLVELAGERDQHWAEGFANMLEYARSKGWMRDGDHVRAHCVRVPAVPRDHPTRS